MRRLPGLRRRRNRVATAVEATAMRALAALWLARLLLRRARPAGR